MKFGVYEEGHEIEETIEAPTLEKAREILEQRIERGEVADLRIVPLCPECGVGLTTVRYEEYGWLDVKKDGYSEQRTRKYVCPMCDKEIGGYGLKAWGFNPMLKVYVVVGLMGGLIEDIKAYTNEEDADEYEKKLCETYELPYDREERHDAESENEVHHYELELRGKHPQV